VSPGGVERQRTLTAADGVSVYALLASCPQPSAVMLLCHGLTTNRDEHGAFPLLRDRALAAGIAVARFDMRAHGRSGGTNAELSLAGVRHDVDAVTAWLAEELDPRVPVIPVGISFGGAAAIHAATSGTRPCTGLVLWYAVVDYRYQYGADSPVRFTRMMRAARAQTDPAWSAMPVVGTSYHLPSALIDEVAGDSTRELLERVAVPVLSYHGSRDWLVDVEPLRRIAATRPNFDVRTAWGAGHGFLLWRPWIVRRTVAWAAALAGLPAP
jgi:alpha-beta hydrolase superfamily lysophospholipase